MASGDAQSVQGDAAAWMYMGWVRSAPVPRSQRRNAEGLLARTEVHDSLSSAGLNLANAPCHIAPLKCGCSIRILPSTGEGLL